MTKARDLDRRIVIEHKVTVKNEFNEDVETWQPLLATWAERKDTSDLAKTELLSAEQVGSFLYSHFVIRSSPLAKQINTIHRISHEGDIWDIKGVKETSQGRNRFIEISAIRPNNGPVQS